MKLVFFPAAFSSLYHLAGKTLTLDAPFTKPPGSPALTSSAPLPKMHPQSPVGRVALCPNSWVGISFWRFLVEPFCKPEFTKTQHVYPLINHLWFQSPGVSFLPCSLTFLFPWQFYCQWVTEDKRAFQYTLASIEPFVPELSHSVNLKSRNY